MSEELNNRIKFFLNKISEEGGKSLEVFKNKENSNSFIRGKNTLEELFIKESSFLIFQLESFWSLFKIVIKNLDNPIIQPWIRVIIEQSSDIIFYLDKPGDEKKNLACKYWLCTLGFLGGNHSGMNYDNFVNLLNDSTEKNKFIEIKEEGYSFKRIHSIWYKIFPSLTEEDKIPSFIEEYFLTIKGNNIQIIQLERFFRDMSLYHHPNLIMNNLEREEKDKSHIFRCFALTSLCGLALLKYLNKKEINKIEGELFESLKEEQTKLYQEIGKVRGLNIK